MSVYSTLSGKSLQDVRVQLGIAAAVISTYALYKLYQKRKYNLPPGPRGLPLLGNLLSIGLKDLYLKFTQMREEYGDIFTVHLGSQAVVVMNNVKYVREAYLQKGDEYGNRPKIYSVEMLTNNGKDIAFGQMGPVWKLQRKIAHGAIRKFASGQHLELLIQSAFDEVTNGGTFEGIINPKNITMELVYNILAGMCFGKHFKKEDVFMERLRIFIEDSPKIAGDGFIADVIPLFRMKLLHTSGLKEWQSALSFSIQYFEQQFDEHLETYNPGDISDLSYELIHLWKKAEKEESEQSVLSQLTKEHMIQVISDMFFAGTETTRCTLSYFFAYMVNYPEIQEKVHQEIKTVCGLEGNISLETKDKLPYTLAALFESMRIMPIVPLGLPHVTTRDTTIGDYKLPKGTQTLMNTWAIHHDPENFPEPYEYKPERWLDENGQFKYHPFTFISFSMGRRVCVGEALAKAEIPMIVALFLQRYKLERVTKESVLIEGDEVLGILEPKPYEIRLELRK